MVKFQLVLVSAGHEKQETIKYPIPIPEHDIASIVNGNSMEPFILQRWRYFC